MIEPTRSTTICPCESGAPAQRNGLGAVTLPIIGTIDTQWLVMIAMAAAVYFLIIRKSSPVRTRNRAKRIIRRVTEF